MACAHSPLSGDSDCGYLCLCVCKCQRADEWIPKCPNIHLYNLHIELTGCDVTEGGGTDPADSMRYVLLSMHEVTSDYFIWKRPRIPSDLDVGNVTIKTEKVLSTLEGGCTDSIDDGPTGALNVKYLSITTDTGKLVYEWDGSQLCKTSGPVGCRVASIVSNWTVTPYGGADLCCMPRKVVRRIWPQATAGTMTLDVTLTNMNDGGYDTSCAGDALKAGSCDCYNDWTYTTDSSSFSGLIDGYYLTAHFEVSAVVDISGGGPCGEVIGAIDPVCLRSCDPTANLTIGPVTLDFGPDDSCRTRQQRLLFNRLCADCQCDPKLTPNKIESPVNYTHLTDCCEGGGAAHPMCPDTGEGWTDTCCPTIVSRLGCRCAAIPTTLASCDHTFPFPTCDFDYREWVVDDRDIAPACSFCACTDGLLYAEG